jgi:hypothetical protein
MNTRYVIERVAKQPEMRRIKDVLRGRYVRQPHGADTWTAPAALTKVDELNLKLTSDTAA